MKPVFFSRRFVFLVSISMAGFCSDRMTAAPAPSPIETLIRELRAEDAAVRVRAADALGELGPRAVLAAKALVEALGDPDDEVRKHVVDALSEIGSPALRSLAGAVKEGDTSRRLLAFDVLFRIATLWNYKPGPALHDISPALIDCLRDKDSEIRSNAVCCLGKLRDVTCVPHLLKLLEREKDIGVRADAILTCGVFGEAGKQAVPVLARIAVTEHDPELAKFGSIAGYSSLGGCAAASLASIGEPAAPALARLVADVKLSPDIRCDVLHAVGLESQVSHVKLIAAVPAICKAVADRDEKVRSMAIYALQGIGSTDKNVLAALRTTMTDDKSSYLRIKAASALYRLDWRQSKVVLPTLLHFLEDKDLRIRRSACSALNMGPGAQAAIPKLIPLVSDLDDDLRLSAVRALGHMGPSIVTAVPALTLATQDSKEEIRRAAQDGLKEAKRWMSKP